MCHSEVTRGQRSKASVRTAYDRIQTDTNVAPPTGPIDLFDGRAELVIGGLHYSPLVRSVVRYDGVDVIRVDPGAGRQPGSISATFTDDLGMPLLYLEENAWIGSLDNWDLVVTGPRLTIRRQEREIALQLRLDPPGRVVIERLDMRIGDAHIVASESAYAAGRYLGDGRIAWLHAKVRVTRASENGAAIEFMTAETLRNRISRVQPDAPQLKSADGNYLMASGLGAAWVPAGIAIASGCAFELGELASGPRTLDEVRRRVWANSPTLARYVATGTD